MIAGNIVDSDGLTGRYVRCMFSIKPKMKSSLPSPGAPAITMALSNLPTLSRATVSSGGVAPATFAKDFKRQASVYSRLQQRGQEDVDDVDMCAYARSINLSSCASDRCLSSWINKHRAASRSSCTTSGPQYNRSNSVVLRSTPSKHEGAYLLLCSGCHRLVVLPDSVDLQVRTTYNGCWMGLREPEIVILLLDPSEKWICYKTWTKLEKPV